MNKQEAHHVCRAHMHRYVQAQMADGSVHDGIVEHVDDDYLYLAVPVGAMEAAEEMRQPIPGYGPWGFPYGGYPFYPYSFGYGFNPFGRRRFRRTILPLAGLLALSLLPYY